MPGPSQAGLLIALIEQVKMERQQEVKRALEFRGNDPIRCAYHTGLADGRNGIVKALEHMLNSASINKGDRVNGRT